MVSRYARFREVSGVRFFRDLCENLRKIGVKTARVIYRNRDKIL